MLPIDEVRQRIDVESGWPHEYLAEHFNITAAADAAWNVALDLDVSHLDASLRFKRLQPKSELPWEDPPVAIEAKVRRIPDWRADIVNGREETPMLPQPPMKPEASVETVDLVPFGFTRLRMTYLPVVGVEKVRTFPDGTLEVV